MNFTGRYDIPAAPDAVWAALHDPGALKAAIPGCEAVERLSPNEFKARAAIGIGPVKARFEGRVTLTPVTPPPGFSHALTLTGEGQGGPAGFARGEANVRLGAAAGGSVLEYDAKAVVGGRLAQLGQRLIDGAAKSLADEFFAKFAGQMRKPAEAAPQPAERPLRPRDENLSSQIWVVGLVAIVILLLILFGIVL